MTIGLTLDEPVGLSLDEDIPLAAFGLELSEPERMQLTIRIKMGSSPYFFTPEKELLGKVVEGFRVMRISSWFDHRDIVLLEEK